MPLTIKETIESVNTVRKCKIVEENGEITQIYVEAFLVEQAEDARIQEIKGIVRSIVGAVNIHHNLDLDYRKIKVIEYKPDSALNQEVHPRIQIIAAYQRRFPEHECIVELYCLNKSYVGRAKLTEDTGVSTFSAFMDAFHDMGFGTLKLRYLQMLTNSFAQERIVLVKVEHTHVNGETDSLMGVAEVQEDLPLAVVKATLNAVNRRIILSS